MHRVDWIEETREGVVAIRPANVPEGLVVAFSGRGHAPEGEATPTAFLARRLSRAIGLDGAPIHWAHQVHGKNAATVRERAGDWRNERRSLRHPRDGASRRRARRPDRRLRADPARRPRRRRSRPRRLARLGEERRGRGGPRPRGRRRGAFDDPCLDRSLDRCLLLRGRRRRRRPVRRRLRAGRLRRPISTRPALGQRRAAPGRRDPHGRPSPSTPPARSAAGTLWRATAATGRVRVE